MGILLAILAAFIVLPIVGAADVQLDVPLYGQRDPVWAEDKLGKCATTLGKEGCAVTSVAMVLKYYGIQTDPKDLNNWLNNTKGGYSKGCLINWKIAAGRSAGTVTWEGRGSANLEKIKSELDNGYPVIAQVVMSKSQHFVVITGYSDNTFYINDPWYKDESTINERYGTPDKAIQSTRLYHGPTVRIIDRAVYCDNKDCTTTTVKPGDNLTFVYNISNPYAYNVSNVRLGAQIRLNGSTGAWIDDTSNGYANDRIVNVTSGAHDYSRNFTIPAGTPDGIYDARWVIINDTTKNWIHSREMINIVTVKEQLPTGPVHNVNKNTDYTTIQAAINAADPGNEIHVDSGTYYENVIITKESLHLKGIDTGSGKPVVDGKGNYSVRIPSNSNNIIFEEFHVTNSTVYPDGQVTILIESSFNVIRNDTITNSLQGIGVQVGHNNELTGNTVSGGVYGIIFASTNNNVIKENTIFSNTAGIGLEGTTNDNIITGNKIFDNNPFGIVIKSDSVNNSINGNGISNSSYGIGLFFAETNNTIITRNNISDNNIGVFTWSSSSNKIYHNNFFKNIENTNSTDMNIWDDGYPSGGNYWDDYSGIDSDGDGIGDTPYLIPGGISADRYPLIKPYSSS